MVTMSPNLVDAGAQPGYPAAQMGSPKRSVRFRTDPALVDEIVAACHEHRLTLEEFFAPAARAHLGVLAKAPPKVGPPRLRRGARLRLRTR